MAKTRIDSAKLIRILHLYRIIKTAPEISPRQIRQELGIGKTTYDRYRQFLTQLGVEFRFDRKAKKHVISQDGFLTTPALSLDERLAIILAVAQLGTIQESFLSGQARRAANKLLAVDEVAVGTTCSSLLRVPEIPDHVGGTDHVVDTLFTAVTERRRARITYCKLEGSPEEYEIDPFQVYILNGGLYLDGYHWRHKAVRCFKVCRIRKVMLTGLHFSNMQGYDYVHHHRNSFCVFTTDKEPQRVRIRFSSFAAPYIREEYHHPSQQFANHEDGSTIYEVTVDEPREVLWWAMRWGGHFEVLEPEWLREEAMGMVREMAGRYGMEINPAGN